MAKKPQLRLIINDIETVIGKSGVSSRKLESGFLVFKDNTRSLQIHADQEFINLFRNSTLKTIPWKLYI